MAGVCGFHRNKQFGKVDNDAPREQYKKLEGVGARAYASQQNAWEALGLFTAAVMVAHVVGADPEKSAIAAIIFLVTRLLHPILYLSGFAALRSVDVVIGFVACLYMFWLAAGAGA